MSTELRELYQEVILDHSKHPRNHRELPEADCSADGFNALCGDRIRLALALEEGVIKEAAFVGSGCAISRASASMMTMSLKGKSIEEARALHERFHSLITASPDAPPDPERDALLGKLAVFSGVCEFPARVKCASLAWHTLDSALAGAAAGQGGDDGR